MFDIFRILKGLRIQQEGTLTPRAIEIVPGGTAGTTLTVTSSQTTDQTVILPPGGTVPSVPVPINQGGTGQTTKTPAFDALAPTTTKGDLIVNNGTNNVRKPTAPAPDGYILAVTSADPTGVDWVIPTGFSGILSRDHGGTGVNSTATFPTSGVVATYPIVLTTDVSGILPTANGGTGQNSTATFPSTGIVAVVPAAGVVTSNGTVLGRTTTVAGDLLYGNGVNTITTLPIGTAAKVLTVSGGLLPVWAAASGQFNTQTFTTNGNFTVPAGCKFLSFTIQGAGAGGGGGGGAGQSGSSAGGGGGGGGGGAGERRDTTVPAIPGDVWEITVGIAGTGGAPGSPGANGTYGADTSIRRTTGGVTAAFVAGGGNPGVGGTTWIDNFFGGVGGNGAFGWNNKNLAGQSPSTSPTNPASDAFYPTQGASGGNGGYSGGFNAQNGGNNSGVSGGAGGTVTPTAAGGGGGAGASTPDGLGGGAGGAGGNTSGSSPTVGANATSFGSGGGGGGGGAVGNPGNAGATGGNGSNGVVHVYYAV